VGGVFVVAGGGSVAFGGESAECGVGGGEGTGASVGGERGSQDKADQAKADCGETTAGGKEACAAAGGAGAAVGVVVGWVIFRQQLGLQCVCWPGPDQVEISASWSLFWAVFASSYDEAVAEVANGRSIDGGEGSVV